MKINKLLNIALLINPPAIYAGLNDTGITTCSNETQNGLPCPVAGFPGQDAEYGTNSFDFTKLDANGNAMAVTATNHSCVQDNVTGLMWEVKTDDGGLRDKDNTYTFDQATTFAANVNATNLCGHNDWRVPNPHELASIVDYSISYPDPTIDENFFPYTSNSYYWTNDQFAANSSGSWLVSFGYGGVDADGRGYDYFVRCVRLGQWLLPLVFTDQGNGTVTEASTGLMWAKCSVGQGATDCSGSASSLTWQQALQAADNSTLAGYTDWRLPNVKELQTLVDYTKYNPSINPSVFPNTPSAWYYSSSPYAAGSSGSWVVSFDNGGVSYYGRNGSDFVRCVRLGQWLLPLALNVAKAGNGAGSVLSNPEGINCGAVCAANFAQNSSVTLTATAATGSVFALWGGACTGTAATCTVTMDAAKSATATFNLVVANPSVVTNAPSVITATSARLNGTVNPKGAATTTSFNFGPTTNYGTNIVATPAIIAATAAATDVSADKTGLTCGSTYHYQVKAVNSAGTTFGADKAFTTSVCPRDLIVTNITLNPAKPVAGTAFSAVVTVKNQGTTATAASKLKLWTNLATVPVCTTVAPKIADIAALAAGASINITVSGLTSSVVGSNTFRTFADGTCVIGETNETNNQKTLSYRIAGRLPDLIITNITLTPATPAKNTVFNAAITVKNQGNTFTDTNYLDVWTNQATAQICGAMGDIWVDVGMLNAGASKVINVTGLIAEATAGAKTLRAFVDSWCETVENNEANNQLSKSYTVQ